MRNKIFKINGHTVGIYDPDNNVFNKKVQDSKHRMRILNAWGIDQTVLSQLPDDCLIKIEDEEKGITYTCLKVMFDIHGQFYHFKEYHTDHNTQRFLGMKHFGQQQISDDERERRAYLKSQGIDI